jgi:signal transduction histidine kinase
MKLDSAIYLKRRAAEIYRELQMFQKLASLSYGIGELYFKLGNYSSATETYLQALAFYENDQNTNAIGDIYNSLGKVSYMSRQKEQAKQYFEFARDIYAELGNTEGLCKTYNNLGILASERKETDLALDLFIDALEWAEELDNRRILGTIYGNIASGYYSLEQYDTVIYYITIGSEILKEIGDWDGLAYNTTNLGLAYAKLKNFELAESYINEGLRIGLTYELKAVQRNAYAALSELHSAKEEFEHAYRTFVKSDSINQLLIDERTDRRLEQLSISYENRLKEGELVQLKAEKRMQLRMNRIYLIIILLGLFFLALVFYGYLSIRRTNSLLGEKNRLFKDYNDRLLASEETLKEMNEAKDRMFSIVAHDIQNPVAAIEGFSELVYENYEQMDDDKIREYIGQIYQGSIMTRDLLENLLLWARAQMDKVVVRKEEISLTDLIKRSIAPVLPSLEKKQLKLSMDVQKDIKVFVDVEMLKAILRNLTTNAMKFSHVGQEITIRAELGEKVFCISVIDHGVGMQEEKLKKLLTPNYYSSSPGTAGETGSGLGLLICKEYTEKNGGTLTALSKPGKGSSFTVCFPLSI